MCCTFTYKCGASVEKYDELELLLHESEHDATDTWRAEIGIWKLKEAKDGIPEIPLYLSASRSLCLSLSLSAPASRSTTHAGRATQEAQL